MKLRIIVLVSVVLNFGLVAGLVHVTKRQPSSPPIPTEAPAPNESPSQQTWRSVPVVLSETPGIPNGFDWSQVESTDFHQYMANLRAIGCPPETVRDLIIAEVNKLFAPRFAVLASQTQRYDYWKPASKKSKEDLRQQLDALQKEKRALLHALLGIDGDPHEKWANVTIDDLAEQGRFGFLSADKEKQVREIMDKYKALGATRQSGEIFIGDGSDSKRLREQRREELARVLTPDELYQFDLRDSNTAESIRGRFGSADLTEEEYRKLFDLRRAYEDEQGAVADNSDPEKMRRRSEARRQLEEGYKTALGEDRNKEVQRQMDPSWRGLSEIAKQFNLSQSVIEQAYTYQQTASEQINALFSNPNVTVRTAATLCVKSTRRRNSNWKRCSAQVRTRNSNNPARRCTSPAAEAIRWYFPDRSHLRRFVFNPANALQRQLEIGLTPRFARWLTQRSQHFI